MSDKERRNYFRLCNKVYVGYRKASDEDVQQFLNNEDYIQSDSIDITYQLDQISRQMSPLLINIRRDSPGVAQYVDLLNQKIDLISSIVSFQQFKMDTEQGVLENAETMDISEGGFSFKSSQELALGSYLFCKIAIIGYRLGMETFGKVVRQEPIKNETGKFSIAVVLPYLKEIDRKNLTRYILDKQREQLRNRTTD